MGRKSRAKAIRRKEKELEEKMLWDEVGEMRNEIGGKILQSQDTVNYIIRYLQSDEVKAVIEKELPAKEGDVPANPERAMMITNAIHKLKGAIEGYQKSIDDMLNTLDELSREHGEYFQDTNANGEEFINFKPFKGEINPENIGDVIKYNRLRQNYFELEHRNVDLYTKTIPMLFLKAIQITGDQEMVKKVEEMKAEVDEYADAMATFSSGPLAELKKVAEAATIPAQELAEAMKD